MVQIRRETIFRQSIKRKVFGLLRFLLMSAVIPLLFFVRIVLYHHHQLPSTVVQKTRYAPTIFDFLKEIDWTQTTPLSRESDIVELDHCDVQKVLRTNFTTWAAPLLNATITALQPSTPASALRKQQREFILELLEIYATTFGYCNFDLYRPNVPSATAASPLVASITALEETKPPDTARLLFTIIAFRGIEQLTRLVEAIYMPHHYIFIHLDQHSDSEFTQHVQDLATQYNNVFVVKFGAIIYTTDSVSMVNLRIMRWVTMDLQLDYDYYVALDGSAYPLFSPHVLASQFRINDHSVWLGLQNHKGRPVAESQTHMLRHKRLIDTTNKLYKRLPGNVFPDLLFDDAIEESMSRKSQSGNQAAYRRDVVEELLESTLVMKIFALSKYGCCCCLEERNWIAALDLIGITDYQQPLMFQLWGGESTDCKGTMKNAVLTSNAELCYRSEDSGKNSSTMYLYGSEMWDAIVDAKNRGIPFARKFSSDNADSIQLLERIRDEFWEIMV